MPLLYHKTLPLKGEIGIWKIIEDEAHFTALLNLNQEEDQYLSSLTNDKRRLEWLASRWLLHKMSGRPLRAACLKDEFGKPYLIDSPFQISISHSEAIVAVMAAPYVIGIDVQKHTDKIERIQHKFMRLAEMESLGKHTRIEHLHIYWGAKEALYKAYGRKQLDFKEHILIEPFDYQRAQGTSNGLVIKGDYQKKFRIYYQKIEAYYLVYALETHQEGL